jgi:hypothetical protein
LNFAPHAHKFVA